MVKKLLKFLRYSILTLIILICISFFVTQLDSVKRYFISFAIESLERETGYIVTIDEVELLFPFEIKGRGITISQDKTLLATCDHLLLRLNFMTLLDKEFNITLLSMNNVHLLKPPQSSPSSVTSIDTEWALTVKRYLIKNLTIDACMSERLCVKPLNAEGHLNWNPLSPLSDASFIANVVSDSSISPTEFGFYLKKDHENVSIELSVNEQEAGGIFFPEGLGVHAATELTSPLNNWIALLNKQPLQEEIEGPIAIKMVIAGDKTIDGMVKGRIAIVEGPSLHFKNFEGVMGKTKISGALQITSDLVIDQSYLTVDSNDLSEFTPLIPLALEGKATFKAVLQGPLTQPAVEFTFKTPELQINGHPLPPSTLQAQVAWKADKMEGTFNWSMSSAEKSRATFQWIYDNQRVDLDLHAFGFAYAGIECQEARLSFSFLNIYDGLKGKVNALFEEGSFHQSNFNRATLVTDLDVDLVHWPYHLEVEGKNYALISEGDWLFDDTQLVIEPRSINGYIYKKKVTLQHPFKMQWRKSEMHITPLL